MKKPSQKTPIALMPAAGIIHAAEALDYGNQEHEPFDFREGGVSLMEYAGAILRHTFSVIDGENVARDSGVDHFGHIIADASIVLDARERGNLIDDRPVAGKGPELLEELKRKRKAKEKVGR